MGSNLSHKIDLSIVIATKDCADDLNKCLSSARIFFPEDSKNYELIIKDCSEDLQVERVAATYGKYLNIKYLHKPDFGIYSAWNQALDLCTGKWILFLGADDLFITEIKFDKLIEKLKKTTKPIVAAPVRYSQEGYEKTLHSNFAKFDTEIRYKNPFHHQGIFHRAEELREIGFDESFKISGDFNTLLKLCNANAGNIESLEMAPIIKMQRGGLSTLVGSNRLRLDERARVRENNKIKTNYALVIPAYLAMYLKVATAFFIGDRRTSDLVFKIKNIIKKSPSD